MTTILSESERPSDLDRILVGKRMRSPSHLDIAATNKDVLSHHDTSPWQAMKRLRVNESDSFSTSTGSLVEIPYLSDSFVASPQRLACISSDENVFRDKCDDLDESANHFTGPQDNVSREHVNPSVQYTQVNHVLNSLHEERLQRSRIGPWHSTNASQVSDGSGCILNESHAFNASDSYMGSAKHQSCWMPQATKRWAEFENRQGDKPKTGTMIGQSIDILAHTQQYIQQSFDHSTQSAFNQNLADTQYQQTTAPMQNASVMGNNPMSNNQTQNPYEDLPHNFAQVSIFSISNQEKHRKLRLHTNSKIG